jgi:hypothetical protein
MSSTLAVACSGYSGSSARFDAHPWRIIVYSMQEVAPPHRRFRALSFPSGLAHTGVALRCCALGLTRAHLRRGLSRAHLAGGTHDVQIVRNAAAPAVRDHRTMGRAGAAAAVHLLGRRAAVRKARRRSAGRPNDTGVDRRVPNAACSAATSAPELGLPLPHLSRDWAHPCHIRIRTGPTPSRLRRICLRRGRAAAAAGLDVVAITRPVRCKRS